MNKIVPQVRSALSWLLTWGSQPREGQMLSWLSSPLLWRGHVGEASIYMMGGGVRESLSRGSHLSWFEG